MEATYIDLGKVSLTPKGDWNRNITYDRIDLVTDTNTGYSYISKKEVPVGISVTNKEYWQKIGSGGYKDNNIIIISDVDENGDIIKHTLQSAVESIVIEDRRPGLLLGFYGLNAGEIDNKYNWFLYQFNSDTIDDWNKLSCWDSVYNNINKFKGYFLNECLLRKQFALPTVGDFSYVGENLNEAVVYVCVENGNWKSTTIPALQFVDKFKGVHSKDFGELDINTTNGNHYNVNVCETYSASTLQQLYKIVSDDNHGLQDKNVFPISVIQAIFDGVTGNNLNDILNSINHLYVQNTGSINDMRLSIDSRIRRKSLIITYVDASNSINTKQYIGDSVTDVEWVKDINWKDYVAGGSIEAGDVNLDDVKMELKRYIDEQLANVPIVPDGYEMVTVKKS